MSGCKRFLETEKQAESTLTWLQQQMTAIKHSITTMTAASDADAADMRAEAAYDAAARSADEHGRQLAAAVQTLQSSICGVLQQREFEQADAEAKLADLRSEEQQLQQQSNDSSNNAALQVCQLLSHTLPSHPSALELRTVFVQASASYKGWSSGLHA